MLKGSIKASVEDSVEMLQSDSLKEAGRRFQGPTWQGVWYVKGEREFAVTKERKPRPPRLRVHAGVWVCVYIYVYARARARADVCVRAREYIRRRRRENDRDLKRERARGRLFHLSPADAAFLSVIVPLTRPAATTPLPPPGDPL